MTADSRPSFQAPVEVAIDEDKIDQPRGFKLFVDDVEVNAGVTSDQLLVSRSTIFMSDMLGNRRFIASLDSVSSFSNFDFLYFDLQHRTNWGFRLFDQRSFYLTPTNATGELFERHQLYRETGLLGIVSYPFDRYHRLDTGIGYENRNYALPVSDAQGNLFLISFNDSFPIVSSTFSGDSTIFKQFGPVSGRRYEISASYAPDIKRGGTLSNDYTIDARQYLQVTSRSLLAARLFVGYGRGNVPNFYYFGGLNTLRGYDFRSIVGNQAAFANFEFRFPLIDVIATPFLAFTGVRGDLFFDIGGAKFSGQPYTFWKNGRLVDGAASVGYGLSFNFWGLELHWDFAKRTDLKGSYGKKRTEFWIGETF
jgi:outer membrane protein assembly factor BamA